MKESTAKFIDQRIKALVNDGNHDVYETRLNTGEPFKVVPWVIYFYYITFLEEGLPSVKHYLHTENAAIPYNQMEGRIRELAWRAKREDPTLVKIGEDFQEIKWEHKSYIAIFMDSPHWKTLKRDVGFSAVAFTTDKSGGPNHSFFDAKDLEVDMSHDGVAESRSAVYFINHMKKSEFGDDLGAYDQDHNPIYQSEKYSFEVYFDVAGGAPSTVFVIDPDGTNMGPPLGPPLIPPTT
jgi:hypothetical protein